MEKTEASSIYEYQNLLDILAEMAIEYLLDRSEVEESDH